jgi:hypothetical protein
MVGQATVAVDEGQTDADLLLFSKGEPLNGPGGANLTAEGAGVFTVTHAWNQGRGPEALEPSLEEGRLQTMSGADLHALPAPDAALQKFLLRQGAGGSNQLRRRKGDKWATPEQGHQEGAAKGGSQEPPPLQIYQVYSGGGLFGSRGSPREMDLDGLFRAEFLAIPAINALGPLPGIDGERARRCLAMKIADSAAPAILGDLEARKAESREKAQEGAQWTKGHTPEPSAQEIEEQDGQKDDANDLCLAKVRRLIGQEGIQSPRLEGARSPLQEGNSGVGEGGQERLADHIQDRVDEDREGSNQQRKGVEDSHQLERKKGGDEEAHEEIVFQGLPSMKPLLLIRPGGFLPQGAHQVVKGAQRADPPAEYPSQ